MSSTISSIGSVGCHMKWHIHQKFSTFWELAGSNRSGYLDKNRGDVASTCLNIPEKAWRDSVRHLFVGACFEKRLDHPNIHAATFRGSE